jgi:hypothetical protein
MFIKNFVFLYLVYSSNLAKLFVNDCHFKYITKGERKNQIQIHIHTYMTQYIYTHLLYIHTKDGTYIHIYIHTNILMQKKELWKFKYFTMQKIYLIIFKKILYRKETKILHNSITNLKFQHKPKNIIFQKSSYKNRPIIIIIIT